MDFLKHAIKHWGRMNKDKRIALEDKVEKAGEILDKNLCELNVIENQELCMQVEEYLGQLPVHVRKKHKLALKVEAMKKVDKQYTDLRDERNKLMIQFEEIIGATEYIRKEAFKHLGRVCGNFQTCLDKMALQKLILERVIREWEESDEN